MRWPKASEAALRGAVSKQVSWVDALAWQVQRRIIEANLQASKANPTVLTLPEKGLRRVQYKTVLQALFEHTTHQLAFRRSRQRWECQICKQSMGETSLVRWLRAGPCPGEIQIMQSIGNSLGMDVCDQSRKGSQEGSVQNRLAVTFRTVRTSIGISAIEAKVRFASRTWAKRR